MGIQMNKPQFKFKFPQIKLKQLHFGKKKVIAIVLVLVFIGGYAIKTKATPLEVTGVVVTPSRFIQTLDEEGTLKAAEESPIYSKVSGQVTKVQVENGKRVEAGDLLYEVDVSELEYQLANLHGQLLSLEGQERQAASPPLTAQVLQQELIIDQARTDLKSQEENLFRMKQLLASGVIPQVEYDGTVGEWERAKNALAIQEKTLDLIYEQSRPSQGAKEVMQGQKQTLISQIDNLTKKIKDSTVKAPRNGIVKDLSLEEGSVIQPGQLILTLFEQGRFEVTLDALAEDVLIIKEGTPANVSIEGNPDKVYNAKVTKIAPAAIEKPSSLGLMESRVPVTLMLAERADLLRPGNKVKVEFIIREEDEVLIIPKSAVFSAGEGDVVWVIRNGKAEMQPVTVGLEDNGLAIIDQGLTEGDDVITDPYMEGLSPGKKVKKIGSTLK